MESKRHPVSLKQYRKMNGKWQFVPVVRDAKGTPDPRLIFVHGQPVSSRGGAFYLDVKENGVRSQIAVGTNARDALEAWKTKLAQPTGLIESDEEADGVPDAGLTINPAIENYLTEIEATKGTRTFRQYRRELAGSAAIATSVTSLNSIAATPCGSSSRGAKRSSMVSRSTRRPSTGALSSCILMNKGDVYV